LKKDKDLTLEEVKYSINFIDQLELPKSKRDKKFISKKPKFVTFTFPTSESYLNVHLWWAGQIIQTRKNIEIGRTRLALASISKFIENIDVETPDLEIEEIKEMYEITKIKHEPGKLKTSRIELKPISKGGLSYWSTKTHRWITGKYDAKNKIFNPPKQNL
jgi:hypothetical protein